MARPGEWINRLRCLGRRSSFETRVVDLEEAGLSRSSAMAQARREFGSVPLAREDSRAAWRFQWLVDLAAENMEEERNAVFSEKAL
jgi:hypothetical protein